MTKKNINREYPYAKSQDKQSKPMRKETLEQPKPGAAKKEAENKKELQPSTIAALSQKRATFAWGKINLYVTGEKKLQEKEQKELRSHIKDVPMMIHTNGLAAAFAFVFSKAKRTEKEDKRKKDYIAIEDITSDWLKEQKLIDGPEENFYQKLITLNPEAYRRCGKEILALYTWLKRYADGMIKD